MKDWKKTASIIATSALIALVAFCVLMVGVLLINVYQERNEAQPPTEKRTEVKMEDDEKVEKENEKDSTKKETYSAELYTPVYLSGTASKDASGDNTKELLSKTESKFSQILFAISNRCPDAEQGLRPVPSPKPIPEHKATMPGEKTVPGRRTVKNFLATALAPVGEVLWVTGGGWKFDDTGADEATRSIGVSQAWLDFFESEDADYDISETEPVDGKNVAHEKGLDTASYVGWAVYNTLFCKDLVNEGFVGTPDEIVALLSDYCDFESAADLADRTPTEIAAEMKPGDFAMMPGLHMYIVIGQCEDASLLVSHMAMNTSSTGALGGGVQVSAVSEGGVECEASALAEEYMAKYPEWEERYDTLIKDTNTYMNFYDYAVGPQANGVFHWKENVLCDPNGYRDKSAEEIMADLYK